MSNKISSSDIIPKNEKEVTLKTNLPEEYQIQNNTITIPSNYDQNNLNKLVKKLLILSDKKSFNFFIDNKLLDKNIHNFLLENPEILKLSEEKSIEVFYSFQMEEPKPVNTIKEDEWIRKISVRKNANLKTQLEYFCVGLFNSEVSFYNKNQEKLFKITDYSKEEEDTLCEILHDVCFYTRLNGDSILLKSSRNETENVKIYNVDLNKSIATQIYSVGKQDSEYVNSLCVNSIDTNFFAAGDTLGNIKIYKIPEVEEKNFNNKKKRKVEISKLFPEFSIEKCHEGKELKHLIWINNQQIISSGEDFHIKVWNINTRTNYLSMNTNHKYVSAISNFVGNTIISGHDDGRIKFWDLNSGKISNIFTGHSNYVSEISYSIDDTSKFVSTGYDSAVNIWDVRANKTPLFSLKTDSEKNYGVALNTFEFLMCGGDSAKINVFSNNL